jgi:hypothetical protein
VSLREAVDQKALPKFADQEYDIFNPLGEDTGLASSNDWVPW